jgi:histidine triad (HIT) family protein
MTDCLFCKIINGEIPCYKIYEDEQIFAFLDIGPVSKGHTLVIPKNHASTMQEGTADDALAIIKTIYHIAPKIMKALGASGYNLGMNYGLSGGQDIFHTHMHFMPRYDGVPRKFEKQKVESIELEKIAQLIHEEF